jgi:hypothetical protein
VNRFVRIDDLPVGACYRPIDDRTELPINSTRCVLSHGAADGRGYHVIGFAGKNEIRDWFFQHPRGVLWVDSTKPPETFASH